MHCYKMRTPVFSILVIAVLLVCNSFCVDLKKGVTSSDSNTRLYNLNHPPLSDYDDIPVKVIYDDYEVPETSKFYSKPKEVMKKIIYIEDDSDSMNINESTLATTTTADTATIKAQLLSDDTTAQQQSTEKQSKDVKNIESDDLEDIDLRELNERKDINVRQGLKPKARSLSEETLPTATSQESDKPAAASNNLETKNKKRRVSQRKRPQKIPKSTVNNTESEPKIITIDDVTPNTQRVVEKYKTLSSSFKVPDIPIIPERQFLRSNDKIGKRNGTRDPVIPIVESESYVFSHRGNFHYSYEGGDGTRASEKGQLRTVDGGTGEAVEGSFSYTDKDGNDFSLTYTADENGYRPIGAHLPTPPPIPPAIQRALDLLATKTTPGESATEKVQKYK